MIVVVGESLVDIVERGTGEPADEQVGGGPLNIAVGTARLGLRTTLVTQVGDDDRGRRITDRLVDDGVELVAVPTSTGRSNTATATLAADGGATYEFELEWTLPPQELVPAELLHVGSIGATLEPGRHSVLDLAEQAVRRGVPVSFDPNLRPAFFESPEAAWSEVRQLAGLATWVKLSDEDAALMRPGDPPAEVARDLLEGEHTRLVIVTCGARGAQAYTREVTTSAPAPEVEVVDTVGAGDSFMAALIAILVGEQPEPDKHRLDKHSLDEHALTEVLRGCVAAAAITCSRPGADPPRRSELPAAWPAGA